MSNCKGCCGNCGSCGTSMELTAGEVELLLTLGQIPFLPVARRADDGIPIYLEDTAHSREEYSLILQCLEKRGLISIDYHLPLSSSSATYAAAPVHGSFALTQRGQQVLELLEIQGIE